MNKVLLFSIFLLFSYSLSSQIRPPVFPEDVDDATLSLDDMDKSLNVKGKSKGRGLSLSYTSVSGGNFIDETGNTEESFADMNNLERIGFKLKVPIINQPKFKLLAGFRYLTETYDFNSISFDEKSVFSNINQKKFKTTGFELIGLQEMKNNRSIALRLKANAKGDYTKFLNFEDRYAVYSGQLIWTKQKNENYEWGVGLTFTHSFRRTIALPFFLMNKTFNDKWGLEMVLPVFATMRYNVSPNTILLFGPKFNSSSYSFNVISPLDNVRAYNLNHSEIRLALSAQQHLFSWIWLDAEVGYQKNFSTDFEASFNESLNFTADPTDAPYFVIGIFLTPPDNVRNRVKEKK